MPVLGQFPTRIHLIDTNTVKWTAGAAYPDPNFPDYSIRDTTADVAIGGVDARTTATETIGATDYTKLVTLSNGGAIAVTLDSTVSNKFFCAVMNIGAGTATLTPSSGQIMFDGALHASIPLVTGQTAVLYFDGTNWEAYVVTNGTLTVAQGGTGDSTLTAHAVLIGEGTSPVAFAGPGTVKYPLVSNGAAADPSFQQLDLTAGVTGDLPVANGGTGDATLTAHAVLVGEGTSPVAAVGPGTNNYPLLGKGASADPAFSQPRGNTAVVQLADSTTSPTSGDLAKFDANGNVADAGILASGVVTTGVSLTADQPVFGAGGNAIKVGTKSGNTDEVATVSGALTSGDLIKSDASGNLVDSGIADPVTVAHGGTGDVTLTAHAVLLGEGTGNVAFAVPGTSGRPLRSTGASTDPAFGALDLTADVTGTLPVANGGTGDATLAAHGVLVGEGTSAVAVTGTGTSGQVLTSNGSSADPTFTSQPYTVVCYLEGKPTASEKILAFKVERAVNFAANFAGSQGRLTANPTATYTYNVNKNGSSIGTIAISTGGAFTFATTGGAAQSLAIGDELAIVGQSSTDVTLSDVGITLLGTR